MTWRNSKRVREISLNQELISRERHFDWFNDVINRRPHEVLIVEWAKRPVGVIQVEARDQNEGRGVWGFYLGELSVPPGLGAGLPVLALGHAFQNLGLLKMSGVVLRTNLNMLRIHKRLGLTAHLDSSLDRVGQASESMEFRVDKDDWVELRERALSLFPVSLRKELLCCLGLHETL
jgi:RimJ/RimL family protein N-acetyltransferase